MKNKRQGLILALGELKWQWPWLELGEVGYLMVGSGPENFRSACHGITTNDNQDNWQIVLRVSRNYQEEEGQEKKIAFPVNQAK